MEYPIIIIGSGVAGLYYVKKFSPVNYLILERENRIGGRVFNIKWNNRQISLGGGVIKPTNKYTLDLCKEYGLETSEFSSSYHFVDYEGNIPTIPNEKYFYNENKNIIEFMRKVYRQNSNEIKRMKLSFNEFLEKYFNFKISKTIKKNLLYLSDLNADPGQVLQDDVIHELLRVADFKLMSIKSGGYTLLLKKLLEKIDQNNIKLNTCVVSINRIAKKYQLVCSDGSNYYCEKLVIATEKNPHIQLNIPNISSIYNLVDGCEYIRVYSYWKNGHGLTSSMRTQNLPGKVILIDDKVLMACYTEYYNAKRLLKLLEKNSKEDQLQIIYDLLNNSGITVPKPDDIIFKFWNVGTHYLNPNTDFKIMRNMIKNMALEENVYLVGEIFASTHGWVDSAIESVELLYNETNNA